KLLVSGRRILQRSNSLSSTPAIFLFGPLPEQLSNRKAASESPARPPLSTSNLLKFLIFKLFQRFVAGSGAHYRELKKPVNTYF
ncbi:hypothetical protein, partial [Pseudomonas delhiensis]|uniref:hypothetical protein n=1 Tax=Pseudomonas delhiensis TaxID=366289 RepID=UPI001C3D490E